MATIADALTAFRVALIDAELVRRPSEAAVADEPPMHIEPQDGAPAPGEREGDEDDATLVVSAFGTELGETNYDSYRRRVIVELRYRPLNNAALRNAEVLDAAIRTLLIGPGTSYGYGFMLGGLVCHQAQLFAGLSTLSRGRGQAYDLTAKWMLEVPA